MNIACVYFQMCPILNGGIVHMYGFILILNTLKHFWLILDQKKISLVVFLWKRRTNSVVYLATILFIMAWYRPIEIILAKKTTELVLLFHKKTTKLIFFWSNMSQICFKVLIWLFKSNISFLLNLPVYRSHNPGRSYQGLQQLLLYIFYWL